MVLLETAMTYHHPMRHDGHLFQESGTPFSKPLGESERVLMVGGN